MNRHLRRWSASLIYLLVVALITGSFLPAGSPIHAASVDQPPGQTAPAPSGTAPTVPTQPSTNGTSPLQGNGHSSNASVPPALVHPLPLVFLPNGGQTDPTVRFHTRGRSGNLFFTPGEVVLALPSTLRAAHDPHRLPPPATAPRPTSAGASLVLRQHFLGAAASAEITVTNQLPGTVNFLVGPDQSKWRTNLPTYGALLYRQLYPGIDVQYTGTEGQLKSTYLVAPGADLSRLRWRYEGAAQITLDAATGALLLHLAHPGTAGAHGGPETVRLTDQAPVAWQEIGGQRVAVGIHYVLAPDQSITFALDAYDPTQPLTIDPTLVYSTDLGGSATSVDDAGYGIAVDSAGNAYVTGSTGALNFPTANAFQSTLGGGTCGTAFFAPYPCSDAFVTKLSADGKTVLYSTFLGGSDDDTGYGIAVDGSGNAYVTGSTNSSNFPVLTAYRGTASGLSDVFVTKLNAAGNALVYSTYLGGSCTDEARGIALDASGGVAITGYTCSTNFPLNGALQSVKGTGYDAFVTKLTAAGTALTFSTYLGGNGDDYGYGIAVDGSGNSYVTGGTASTNFATTTGVLQRTCVQTSGSCSDAFVTKLNTTGGLVYSTYLGGNNGDGGYAIAVDTATNVYVTGSTSSTTFPTVNPAQASNHGGTDVFVTKLNASASALVYSTYLGGNGIFLSEAGYGIAVDKTAGTAAVIGMANSPDFPTLNARQATNAGGPNGIDAFVTKLSATGSLLYSTFHGGSGDDAGYGIALDGAGNAYLTGSTASTNFPLANAYQATGSGGKDVFVTKLNASGNSFTYSTYLAGPAEDTGWGVAVDAQGNSYLTGYTYSTNYPTANPIQTGAGLGRYDAFVTKLNPTGQSLIYSTYLGGSGVDRGWGIAVDANGNAVIGGWTSSTDFPLSTPLQASYSGGTYDGFLTKLNATGTGLIYSTYLGGNGEDWVRGVAVDGSGNVYGFGSVSSATGFPVSSTAYQRTSAGGREAFVTKLSTSGGLVYSTFLGGSGSEWAGGTLAVDGNGNAIVAGLTTSTNFPVQNAWQASCGLANGSCTTDAFVTKLNAAGTGLVYSTYLGGNGEDYATCVAVDSAGNAYITGKVRSSNFPLVTALKPSLGGVQDAFVTKLTPTGSVSYSTYLGGSGIDMGWGIAVKAATGEAYVTGETTSTDLSVVNPFQSTNQGGSDAFVVKLTAAGTGLVYSTYLGGSSDDFGYSVAVDSNANAYVTGSTASSNFPTTAGTVQPAYRGGGDIFLTKLTDANRPPSATLSASPTSGRAPLSVTFTTTASDPENDPLSYSWTYGDGTTDTGPGPKTHTYTTGGTYTAIVTVTDGKGGSTQASAIITVTANHPPTASLAATPTSGLAPLAVTLTATASDLDGDPLSYSWNYGDGSATESGAGPKTHTYSAAGVYTATVTVSDGRGGSTQASATITVTSNRPPTVTVSAIPTSGAAPITVTLTATASDPDGDALSYSWNYGDGSATDTGAGPKNHTYTTAGIYTATVTVIDGKGGTAQANVTIAVNVNAPPVVTLAATPMSGAAPLAVTFTATASDPNNDPVTYSWNYGDGSPVESGPGPKSHTYSTAGTYTATVTVDDGHGGSTRATRIVEATRALVPAPVDTTAPTDIYATTSFIYGANGVQTGVTETITSTRVSVLRGRVLSGTTPLPNVTITILGWPGYGQTLTRADGMFDLVVNGGGTLTVQYAKDGYLPVQRQITPAWRDYTLLPEVVMTPVDPQVTALNLGATTMQVARGTRITDTTGVTATNGVRQATLLFPPTTTVTIDGVTVPVTQPLHVHMTEYTVGPNGPKSMPGQLPPNTGYTYAVEFSLDEAGDGQAVQFSQPVINYVENFLGFQVPMTVPVGYYDRTKAAWVPAPNGYVINVTDIVNGKAVVDTGGLTLTPALSDAELEQLALLYPKSQYPNGMSLWRVPVTHFSAWDFNWPFGPPPGSKGPAQQPDGSNKDEDKGCQSAEEECLNQILNLLEQLASQLDVTYAGDRVPGRTVKNEIKIPLTRDTVPSGVTGVTLGVSVAGQSYTYSYTLGVNGVTTLTNLIHIFRDWDGNDAYGRPVQGQQQAQIRIGYVYPGVYLTPSERPGANYDALFGHFSYYGTPATANPTRQEVTLWQERTETLGGLDASQLGLAGWNLGIQHVYDTVGHMLYLGTGQRRSIQSLAPVIQTVRQLQVFDTGVAVGADGAVYVATGGDSQGVQRVNPDGTTTMLLPVVSTHGQAEPFMGVALSPNNTIYAADGRNNVIRQWSNGQVITVAGKSNFGYSGDGGTASSALLNCPMGVAVGPDGSLYIADTGNNSIRQIQPDGIIRTLVGGDGTTSPCDRGTLTQSGAPILDKPMGVAVGPDGSLYIADTGHKRVLRLAPDGTTQTVMNAAMGLGYPHDVEVGPDGAIYVTDFEDLFNPHFLGFSTIWRIGTDGSMTALAGRGTSTTEGVPAVQAKVTGPWGIALSPDGTIYFSEHLSRTKTRLLKIAPALPGYTGLNEMAVPSEDGSEVYIFNAAGRHLRTINAATNTLVHSFTYNTQGFLTQITDGDGLTTTISRTNGITPTAIIEPSGFATTFTVDTSGYIRAMTDPAGNTTVLTYTTGGLLTQMQQPNGSTTSYGYDLTSGRLLTTTNPAGDYLHSTRIEGSNSYTATQSTNLGRTITRTTQTLPSGTQRRTTIAPNGLSSITDIQPDGSQVITSTDGSVTTMQSGPDPRWGMQVPLLQNMTLTLPSGMKSNVQMTRTSVPSDPTSPLQQQTDMVTINGRTFTTTLNVDQQVITSTSPMGRQSVTYVDAQGRLTQTVAPGVAPTTYSYDPRGNLIQVTQGERSMRYGYDEHDRLITVTNPLNQQVVYGYDLAGNVITTTMPDGQVILAGYDANGNVTSLTPPGQPAHTFGLNANGQPTVYQAPSVATASNYTTTYDYDADQQLVQITRPDGVTITLTYDAMGRVSSTSFPRDGTRVQIGYGYDAHTGQLVTMTAPSGIVQTFGYDGGLLTTTSFSGPVVGTLDYRYNTNFQMVAERVNSSYPVTYSYDLDGLVSGVIISGTTQASLDREPQTGRLLTTTLGNLSSSYTYDASYGEVTGMDVLNGGSAFYHTAYSRDALGRITVLTETVQGTVVVYGYTYDTAGHLVAVAKNGQPYAGYSYDSNGNRTVYTDSHTLPTPLVVTGSVDAQDRLLQYGSISYIYTANGELQRKSTPTETTSYTYDVFGNLISATLPSGMQVQYTIDSSQRRVGKLVNGTRVHGFLYAGSRIVAELDGNNNLVSRFVYLGDSHVPDALVKPDGSLYRLVKNHLGSVRLVVNATTGQVVQQLDYDEFGQVLTDTNPGFQPFGFAGGLYDRDTGLVRFGARDYDPQTGRWTSKDPLRFGGGDTNLYGYVLNDPVNAIDPSGLFAFWDAVDVLFFAMSVYEFSECPSFGTGLDLFLNSLGLLPIVPSVGWITKGSKVVKAIEGKSPRLANVLKRIVELCANSFSADTPVATDQGDKPISKIQLGDHVLAYDEATGATGYYTVTAIISHTDPAVLAVTIADEHLTTTQEHPFFTRDRGWVKAGELRHGEQVRRADGSYGAVQAVVVVQQAQTMYNLTVADAHTFFVGKDHWLVHNTCGSFEKHGIETATHLWEKLAFEQITEAQALEVYFKGEKYIARDGSLVRFDPKTRITILIDKDTGKVFTAWRRETNKPSTEWTKGW